MKYFYISLCLTLTAMASCKCGKKTTKTESHAARNFAAEGYVQASVQLYDVDGCKWLLSLPEGKRLVPSSILPAAYQSDGLTVWLKYAVKKSAVGTCMAGEVIDVVGIETRKP